MGYTQALDFVFSCRKLEYSILFYNCVCVCVSVKALVCSSCIYIMINIIRVASLFVHLTFSFSAKELELETRETVWSLRALV